MRERRMPWGHTTYYNNPRTKENYAVIVRDATGSEIARIQTVCAEDDEATAEIIVSAVNAHADMRVALEDARAALGRAGEMLSNWDCKESAKEAFAASNRIAMILAASRPKSAA